MENYDKQEEVFNLPGTKNILNGKAFEYAIAAEYKNFLLEHGIKAVLSDDRAMKYSKFCFDYFNDKQDEQQAFVLSARSTIDTLIRLEPGLTSPKDDKDILTIRVANDMEGVEGDVRDVIFSRKKWEVGFSAKNNNDDVKHSRLSMTIDFGAEWLGHPVSEAYWDEIRPIFSELSELKEQETEWKELENKSERFYIPVLLAFKKEMIRLAKEFEDVPEKLVMYLLGRYPFYKIIKYDSSNLVVVKAFNINGLLNKTVNHVSSEYKAPKVNLPTRIVELDWKTKLDGTQSDNTMDMILDRGWEISFRLHNGDGKVIPSLKFAVQLLGNPPVLFTQYIFKDKK